MPEIRGNPTHRNRSSNTTYIYPVLSETHMTLLTALEARLGNMDDWPSQILRQLFVEEPTFSNVESVAAFFYGNGALCGLCSQTFHACNAAATGLVTGHIYELFASWQQSPFGHRMSIFYSLQSKRYLHLNGRRMEQFEVARAPRGGRHLGIAATGHPDVIAARLQYIRDKGLMFY